MSDKSTVSIVLNVVLCGASGFGLLKIGPAEHPWAFTSCLIGFTHGLVGLVGGLAGDENAKKIAKTTSGVMEIIPLPLFNVDLYLGSECTKIALCNGLFMVPLTVSVILAFFKSEGEGEDVGGTLSTLKVLTILGNITALVYLTINEKSVCMAGMAAFAFMAKFGAEVAGDHMSEKCDQPIKYLSWSGFFIYAAFAVSGEK